MTTIPCVRCSAPIERKLGRGRKPKYCQDCAIIINREKQRDRDKAIHEDQALVRAVAENLREHLDPSHYARLDDYINSLGMASHLNYLRAPVVPDRQPVGTLSDAGSNDGVSTYFTDLAADLEYKRMQLVTHDWFKENPRWTDGI